MGSVSRWAVGLPGVGYDGFQGGPLKCEATAGGTEWPSPGVGSRARVHASTGSWEPPAQDNDLGRSGDDLVIC